MKELNFPMPVLNDPSEVNLLSINRNQALMLIKCSRNVSYYNQFIIGNILVKIMFFLGFFDE